MFLFPMYETSYWAIGLVILFICSFTGLLIGKFKGNGAYKGFITGFEYGFIFWTMLYLLVGIYLK